MVIRKRLRDYVVGIINNDDDEQCRKDRKSVNYRQCVIAETLTKKPIDVGL